MHVGWRDNRTFNPDTGADHGPPPPRHALVLGATGAFGAHVSAALIAKGWTLTALARDPDAARRKAGVNMRSSGRGATPWSPPTWRGPRAARELIVHAVNPPRYRNWAARFCDAGLDHRRGQGRGRAHPPAGTVYNFAPNSGPRVAEDAAQAPVTRKGAIRARMEARLREAAAEGVKSLIMRAGDFFGPRRRTAP